jgi:hypothetical protein
MRNGRDVPERPGDLTASATHHGGEPGRRCHPVPEYGSRHLLADQGIVPVEAGAPVELAGPGLVAASPVQAAGGVPGRIGAIQGRGGQRFDLVDGERDEAGVGWWRLSRAAGGGAWLSVRSLSWAAVTARMARAAITSTRWRRIAV